LSQDAEGYVRIDSRAAELGKVKHMFLFVPLVNFSLCDGCQLSQLELSEFSTAIFPSHVIRNVAETIFVSSILSIFVWVGFGVWTTQTFKFQGWNLPQARGYTFCFATGRMTEFKQDSSGHTVSFNCRLHASCRKLILMKRLPDNFQDIGHGPL